MDNENLIRRLIETDPVERTVERLQRSIREHEQLLARFGQGGLDEDLESLRCALTAELDRKRHLLGVLY